MADEMLNYKVDSSDLERTINKLNNLLSSHGDRLKSLTSFTVKWNEELEKYVITAKAMSVEGRKVDVQYAKLGNTLRQLPKSLKISVQVDTKSVVQAKQMASIWDKYRTHGSDFYNALNKQEKAFYNLWYSDFQKRQRLEAQEAARLARATSQNMRRLSGGDLSSGIALGLSDAQLGRIQQAYAQANLHTQRFANRQQQLAQAWYMSWDFWSRYLTTRVLNSVSYSFINAARQSVQSSIEMQKSVSLIQTIDRKSLTFDQWTKSIQNLSNNFGIAMKDVSEGVYETISNQISKGAGAIDFMSTALQFAATTGSTAKQSMDLLSSVLNAFSLNASQATNVAASLFKTIDLGRVKAADMAETYGRVAPLAAAMGLSFDELNASIAVGTIAGIKFNVSSTELINIMNKLLKPTKEMTKLLHTWGYETGQDLVAAEGWAGALEKIYQVVQQNGTAYGAKLFGDIRAVRGFFNLSRGEMEKFKSYMKEFNGLNENGETPNETYFRALQVSFNTAGKQLEMEITKFKNLLINDLGQPITEIGVKFLKAWGGIEGIIKSFIPAFEGIAAALLAAKLANGQWILTSQLFTTVTRQGTASLQQRQIALTKEIVAVDRRIAMGVLDNEVIARKIMLTAELTGVTNSLTVAQERSLMFASKISALGKTVGWLIALEVGYRILKPLIEGQIEDFGKAHEIENQYTSAAMENSIARIRQYDLEAQARDKNITETKNKVLQGFANASQGILTDQDEMSAKINKIMLKPLDEVIKGLDYRISLIKKAIDRYVANIQKSEGEIINILAGNENRSKIVDMIENIGKVDEGWNKARVSLALYQQRVKKVPQEQQDFNKKYGLLTQYRQSIAQQMEKSFGSGDVDQGRIFAKESLSLADKMYNYGWTLNEVYRERQKILERTLTLEENYKQQQQIKVNAVNKDLVRLTNSTDSLRKKREELSKVITDSLHVTGTKDEKDAKVAKLKIEIEQLQSSISRDLKRVGKFDLASMLNAGLDPDTFKIGLFENNSQLATAIHNTLKLDSFKSDLLVKMGEQSGIFTKILQNSENQTKIDEQRVTYTKEIEKQSKALADTTGKLTDNEKKKLELNKNFVSITDNLGKVLPKTKFLGENPNIQGSLSNVDWIAQKVTGTERIDRRMLAQLVDYDVLSKTNTMFGEGTGIGFSPNIENINKLLQQVASEPRNTSLFESQLEILRNLATALGSDSGPNAKLTEAINAALEVRKLEGDTQNLTKAINNLTKEIETLNSKNLPAIKDGFISKNGRVTRIADDDHVLAFRDYTSFGRMITQFLRPSGKNRFNDLYMSDKGTYYDLSDWDFTLEMLRRLGIKNGDVYSKNYAISAETIRRLMVGTPQYAKLAQETRSKTGFFYAKPMMQTPSLLTDLFLANDYPTIKKKKEIKEKANLLDTFHKQNVILNKFVKATDPFKGEIGRGNETALSKYFWDQKQAQSGRGAATSPLSTYYTDQAAMRFNIRNQALYRKGSNTWDRTVLGAEQLFKQGGIAKSYDPALTAAMKLQWQAEQEAQKLYGTRKKDKFGNFLSGTAPSEGGQGYAMRSDIETFGRRRDNNYNIGGMTFTLEELKELMKNGAGWLRDMARAKLLQLGERINDGLILKNGKVIHTSQDDNIYATKNDINLARPDYTSIGSSQSNRFNNPAINLNGNLNASFNVNGRQLAKEIVPFMIDDSKKGRNSLVVAR